MSAASLQYRHAFGFRPSVRDCVWYLNEKEVVYPAGHNVVVLDTEHRTQQFFHGANDSEGITALAVSPNKSYIAVAERAERGVIHVFERDKMKKRKTLRTTDCASSHYVSLCFSPDSSMLLSMGGPSDWTLVCWMWQKGKVVATVKVCDDPKVPVYQCSFNPVDPTMACVTGKGLLRFFRLNDGQFRQVPSLLGSREPQDMLCHAWMLNEKLVVGTDTGELLVLAIDDDAGTMREVLRNIASAPADGPVHCLIPYSKGFVCGCGQGMVRLYEQSEWHEEHYKLSRTFHVVGHEAEVVSMAVSPREDRTLVCGLSNNQLMSFPLCNADLLKEEEMNFTFLTSSFHERLPGGQGAITGMDVCVRKPLVVTCGSDRTVRVWNYLDKTTELVRAFPEEVHSVAFHPSGLHMLVGFSDKLRLMNVLIDDIRVVKELPVKSCRECCFSNGGHLFAAVNGNSIQVFSTYTCEQVSLLRAHNGKVQSLHWMYGDVGLVSAGADGAIYQWEVFEVKREGEFVQKGCKYSCAVASRDGAAVFAVGSDRQLKEIEFPASQVSKELDCGAVLSQVVLSRSERLFFAGTAESRRPGAVRSYKFPFTGDFEEYPALSSAITRMRMSADDQFLFVAGKDGTLLMFEVRERDGRVLKRDRDLAVGHSEETLVTKNDLEERQALVEELSSKVSELKSQAEYQLHLKDMDHSEKIKEATEKFTQELEQDKNRYELLNEEKNDMEIEFEERIKQMAEKAHHDKQRMEAMYQKRIMQEVEKYQRLVQERDQMQAQQDTAQQALIERHQQYVAEVTEDYEAQLAEARGLRTALEAELAHLMRTHDETRRQLEEDIDQEIEDMKAQFEDKLGGERDATLRFKGENGIMRKKFNTLQKDIEDQREQIKQMLDKEKKLLQHINALEQEVQLHKRAIRERDDTIGEKEKRIYDLKKKNQELEKFKFVLDYKIKDLKLQIEPRETEIAKMKKQIKEMDAELEDYHKCNAQLDLMIGELRQQLDVLHGDIKQQRQKGRMRQALIQRFRSELHECVQYIQDPRELRECITRLYRKHVPQESAGESGDAAIHREYRRQREYLETSVANLKKKLAREQLQHRQDNMRVMQDNMGLIKEIHRLRREIRAIKTRIRDGQQSAAPGREAAGDAGVAATVPASPEVLRAIEDQRAQVGQLKARIRELEATAMLRRPISRERLPPIDNVTPRSPRSPRVPGDVRGKAVVA